MFRSSSVRYRSFSVRVNFRSIISGYNSGRISIRLIRVIRVASLLPGLRETNKIARQIIILGCLGASVISKIVRTWL